MSETLKRNLILMLGVLGASTSCLFVRWSDAPSLVLACYRMGLTAVLMTPLMFWRFGPELKAVSRRNLLLCLAAGTSLGIHFTCYFASLNYTCIAVAQTLCNAEVFFVALISYLLWKEKIPLRGWLGVIIIFVGGIIITVADSSLAGNAWQGDLMAVSAALTMGIYTLIGRRVRRDLSTLVYTYLVYTCAALTLALMLAVSGNPAFGYSSVNWLCALAMVFFCTFGGHTVYSWALKYFQAAHVSTMKLLDPFFSTMLGVLVFADLPPLAAGLGCLLLLAGTFIYIRTSQET